MNNVDKIKSNVSEISEIPYIQFQKFYSEYSLLQFRSFSKCHLIRTGNPLDGI